jgi:hypothetical protein
MSRPRSSLRGLAPRPGPAEPPACLQARLEQALREEHEQHARRVAALLGEAAAAAARRVASPGNAGTLGRSSSDGGGRGAGGAGDFTATTFGRPFGLAAAVDDDDDDDDDENYPEDDLLVGFRPEDAHAAGSGDRGDASRGGGCLANERDHHHHHHHNRNENGLPLLLRMTDPLLGDAADLGGGDTIATAALGIDTPGHDDDDDDDESPAFLPAAGHWPSSTRLFAEDLIGIRNDRAPDNNIDSDNDVDDIDDLETGDHGDFDLFVGGCNDGLDNRNADDVNAQPLQHHTGGLLFLPEEATHLMHFGLDTGYIAACQRGNANVGTGGSSGTSTTMPSDDVDGGSCGSPIYSDGISGTGPAMSIAGQAGVNDFLHYFTAGQGMPRLPVPILTPGNISPPLPPPLASGNYAALAMAQTADPVALSTPDQFRHEARKLLSETKPFPVLEQKLKDVYRAHTDLALQLLGPKPPADQAAALEAYRKKKNSITSTACSAKKKFGVGLMKPFVFEITNELLGIASVIDEQRSGAGSHSPLDAPACPELHELSTRVHQACSGMIHEAIESKVEAEAEAARKEKAVEKAAAEERPASISGSASSVAHVGAVQSSKKLNGVQKPRAGLRKSNNCATAHKNNRLKKLRFDLYLKKSEELCRLRAEVMQAIDDCRSRAAGLSIRKDTGQESHLVWYGMKED